MITGVPILGRYHRRFAKVAYFHTPCRHLAIRFPLIPIHKVILLTTLIYNITTIHDIIERYGRSLLYG